MLRLDVAAYSVTVRANGVYHVLADTARREQLGCLFAMLVGVKLEIYVVQKPHDAPIISLVAVTELFGIPTHNALDRQRMLNMKQLFVVFAEKRKRLVPCYIAFSHF